MAKEKFNYRPVYFISAMMALLVVLAMVVPDPFANPGKGPIEQRNMLVFFKADVPQARQREVIRAADAVVYRNDEPGEYEVVLNPNRVLNDAFDFFDRHDDVLRASIGGVEHAIMIQRDVQVEVKR